eukprot:383419-Amphidinium_carterae.1
MADRAAELQQHSNGEGLPAWLERFTPRLTVQVVTNNLKAAHLLESTKLRKRSKVFVTTLLKPGTWSTLQLVRQQCLDDAERHRVNSGIARQLHSAHDWKSRLCLDPSGLNIPML